MKREKLNASQVVKAYAKGRRDFRNCDLRGGSFEYDNLSGADFRGANLEGSNFSGANLRNANFKNTDIDGVNFIFADLSGANLIGTMFEGYDDNIKRNLEFYGVPKEDSIAHYQNN